MIRFSPNRNRAHLIPWQEWSDDAFRAAGAESKPVMLFLSAFWCRYCQRMDEEAFSETEVIALLSAYFIPLRVEYMQRPDVDARYNLNGWPTIAFMTPNGQLLSAVNYLAADQFKELLIDVYMGFEQRREERPSGGPGVETAKSPARKLADSEFATNLAAITESVMALADPIHGGYDRGQKFIHPQVNDFLLERYEATGDGRYLDQVGLTLQQMRAGEIYDREGGAYFRTSSHPDWSHPHREKLLLEEAGLLANCLRTFQVTQAGDYRRMAEEIICYLDANLFDPASRAYYGCEDWLRHEDPAAGGNEFFTIIDRCIYTDANAVACAAFLDAAVLLDKPSYGERARGALEFLWQNCRSAGAGMFHYYDGTAHVPGLLQDQAQIGIALLRAYAVTAVADYLDRARWLAQFILTELKNPDGGFYDIPEQASASLKLRLSLIEQNGIVAGFFLRLAQSTGDVQYRHAARWALTAFSGNFASYGLHAAEFGRALGEYLADANL